MISAAINTDIWLRLLGGLVSIPRSRIQSYFWNAESQIPMIHPIKDTLNTGRNITQELFGLGVYNLKGKGVLVSLSTKNV